MPIEQTQIIKRSIQNRLKYRIPGVKSKLNPGLVVPDPNNRGKDPMAPTHRPLRGHHDRSENAGIGHSAATTI